MKKIENKPLSFSTTMRNPERIAKFLNCVIEYESQLLTTEIIMSIVKRVIKEKLYMPNIIKNDTQLKKVYENEESKFSEEQLNFIIEKSEQNHKEAGFDKGWESRFDTWYKLSKEFGFLYYQKNRKIEISSSGHMLCTLYNDLTYNSGAKIQKIFLNALMKYHTNNPFRRTANNNVPIPLLLNVIKLLRKNGENNGISRKELSFFICWGNNDAIELYEFIKNFRMKNGYKVSDEIVYEECLKILKSENRKRFKLKQIVKEGIDDLIRKLRITGLFSLRGMGRFLDINNLELKIAEYVIEEYSKVKEFKNEYTYYEYMGKLDSNVITLREIELDEINEIRVKALKEISEKYTISQLRKEFEILQKNSGSRDEYLKLIDSPTRLEFLMSMILHKTYPNCIVKPNYAIDDEGNPTFTAKGGISDIEFYDEDIDSLIEVTLMRNKQQAVNEIPGITRHLKEQRAKSNSKDVFAIFVAPVLHEDTLYMCDFSKYREDLEIIPYSIAGFLVKIINSKSILDFKKKVKINNDILE